MTEPPGAIHSDDPFATPLELREPGRRFRGRLAAPVTVWTAGSGSSRTGLTVSSLLLAEGEPPLVLGLIAATTDLWLAIEQSRTFVVHILENSDRPLADRFAGRRPSPGGLFSGLDVQRGEWGPVLGGLNSRAFCRYVDDIEVGFHLLVSGEIQELELHDLTDPLVYHRGEYHRLNPS